MKNKTLYTLLFLLVLIMVLISLEFYLQTILDGLSNTISLKALIIVVNIIILSIALIFLLLVRNIVLSAKQERLLKVQEIYIKHLRELIKVIKYQRHDFVNHLQTVYALLKTDQIEKSKHYIEDMYQEVLVTNEMLRCNIPELSALLLVKTGVATGLGITFEIEIQSSLPMNRIKPTEINPVIGNLIDNAFEAADQLNITEKMVNLKIFKTPKNYVLQVWNHGFIVREIMGQIFLPGFSTKSKKNNRGFGLASVNSIAQKNGWKIVVNSNEVRGTKFTVIIPKE